MLRYIAVADFPHVSHYPVRSIEQALAARGIDALRTSRLRAWTALGRVLARLRLPLNLYRAARGPVFVVCMGPTEAKTLPLAWWTELIPYCFDCWQPRWGRWESFFRRQRIRLAFFTARQSAAHFAARLPQMTAIWLPEAVDPGQYDASLPLVDRPIDVLELGRKYELFHDAVRDGLAHAGRVHRFERVKGQIIFPTAAEFRRGLGDSKISICFPSSMTHPERSGDVETVTLRYFESFASGCVVAGHCPAELKELFGYNPVVEITRHRELEQMAAILERIEDYRPLVARNYSRMLEAATWEPRIDIMLEQAYRLLAARWC